jgi:two-component system, cell cycle sensor histidine kinase and response regulator CckA
MAINVAAASFQGSRKYPGPGRLQATWTRSIRLLSPKPLLCGLAAIAAAGMTAAVADGVAGWPRLISPVMPIVLAVIAAGAAAWLAAAAATRPAFLARAVRAGFEIQPIAADSTVLPALSGSVASGGTAAAGILPKVTVSTADPVSAPDVARCPTQAVSDRSGSDLACSGPARATGYDPLQPFFADAPVGIAVVDRLGHLVNANRALGELFGTAPETLIGRGLLARLNPEDRATVAERLANAAAGREDHAPIEIRLAPPGERTMVLLLRCFDKAAGDARSSDRIPWPGAADPQRSTAIAAPPPAEAVENLTLYFIDVTEQKHLEAQFAQSQKMQAIGQLAGGVAHDFNNLLTAMIGFCDLLLLRARPGDPAFADIMQIKQNANRAANLVRQLLAFSRQQSLRPRVLDITEVLAELAHLLRRLIGENIELEFVHGRDLGLVKVDQGQLEQVVINLAVNARDAMADGGRLTIRTANVDQPAPLRRGTETMPAGDYVVIEVADTGIGIAPDTLGRIFEPFFSTKEVGSGTGLGLSTVYGIVKQTGGFVFVESRLGRGTTFSIYLPRHQATEPAPCEMGEPEPAIARDLTGSGTVVLVEDDDAVRVFGARALRNKGYRVIEAKSGESALAMIKNAAEPIELVITDVVMPHMDGPALVRELRLIDCRAKVIFISGYAEDGFRQRLDQERDIHFLPKPFNLKQLALKVKEVLRDDPVS